ncbi:MAG TPA: hypothetical protein PK011_15400, partial [Marinagarivorans sp.]|nr:hypothetical protein [Marinagarivorans sp.]
EGRHWDELERQLGAAQSESPGFTASSYPDGPSHNTIPTAAAPAANRPLGSRRRRVIKSRWLN